MDVTSWALETKRPGWFANFLMLMKKVNFFLVVWNKFVFVSPTAYVPKYGMVFHDMTVASFEPFGQLDQWCVETTVSYLQGVTKPGRLRGHCFKEDQTSPLQRWFPWSVMVGSDNFWGIGWKWLGLLTDRCRQAAQSSETDNPSGRSELKSVFAIPHWNKQIFFRWLAFHLVAAQTVDGTCRKRCLSVKFWGVIGGVKHEPNASGLWIQGYFPPTWTNHLWKKHRKTCSHHVNLLISSADVNWPSPPGGHERCLEGTGRLVWQVRTSLAAQGGYPMGGPLTLWHMENLHFQIGKSGTSIIIIMIHNVWMENWHEFTHIHVWW